MTEWWASLTALNKAFYYAALFFGVLFLWQIIAALIGLGEHEADADADVGGGLEAGDADVDAEVAFESDATYDDFEQGAAADAIESTASFKLLGVRSVITFFTLFTWGGAMYMDSGVSVTLSITYGMIWGLIGMFIIAGLFYLLRRLTETGTADLASCVGSRAMVYLNIPAGGQGEIRAKVGGVMKHVKARAGDQAIEAGRHVRVVRRLTETSVEVEPVAPKETEAQQQKESSQ